MRLYFIRHAQSQNNALWDTTGSNKGRNEDPDLTTMGLKQAQLVAAGMKDILSEIEPAGDVPIHLYCSLMQRAVRTANAISRELKVPLKTWYGIHEGGGIYLEDDNDHPIGQAGKPRAFFEDEFPELELPDEVDENGWWNKSFEEREERFLRARQALADLKNQYENKDDVVIWVSHGAFFYYFISAMMGLPDGIPVWMEMNNTGITRIDFGEETRIRYTNRTAHLPGELIT
jgi:2,3-bisphosphoglycerate-dependent phosphoglycerate mutase